MTPAILLSQQLVKTRLYYHTSCRPQLVVEGTSVFVATFRKAEQGIFRKSRLAFPTACLHGRLEYVAASYSWNIAIVDTTKLKTSESIFPNCIKLHFCIIYTSSHAFRSFLSGHNQHTINYIFIDHSLIFSAVLYKYNINKTHNKL